MKIWFVTIGEPVPVEVGFKERLHRAGMMATAFAEAGHDVIWWTSGFDHFKKRHIVSEDKEFLTRPNLRIRVIKAPGYRRNVSLARLYDHHQIKVRFLRWARTDNEQPDIIVSSLPSVGLCQAGITLGKAWNIPVIVDVRDLWPDIFTEVVPKPLRAGFRLALTPLFRDCQRVCRQATALMGTTDEFVQWGLNLADRDRGEFDTTVPFLYPQTEFSPEELRGAEQFWDRLGITGGAGTKIVAYVGSMGRQFRLEALIRCAHRMTARDANLKFALCGSGESLELYRKLADGNPAIVLPGWVDAVKIRTLLQRAAVGFDPMPNRYDFLANINNKAVEYLAGGVPILSTPSEGTLARLIRQAGIGESTIEGDDQTLEAALNRLLGDPVKLWNMKGNARRLYDDQFSPRVYDRLIAHVRHMVGESAVPV